MAETNELELSEFVQKYLEPIPGESPSGSDAGATEEYFKLNMEIPKTIPDYKLCIELCDTILLEKSKDLKVAAWLCFALFRIDKFKGLMDGLNIIYHLLTKYSNSLFPSNVLHRSKALQFLNTPRFFKLVEREEINASNASFVIEADKLLTQIIAECERLFQENGPVLKSLQETFELHLQKARQLTAGSNKATEQNKGIDGSVLSEKAAASQTEAIKDKDKEVANDKAGTDSSTGKPGNDNVFVTPSGKIEDSTKPQQNASASAPLSSPLKEIKAGSEKEAATLLRQILLNFFEDQQDGIKKEKVPSSTFVFGISRQLQWEKLYRPIETDKVTQISAPNQIIQSKIKEWFSTGNWDMLIPRVEINCLKNDSEFTYWLDVHRYIVKALEQKGGSYTQASEDIKFHLARLLKRIPDLPQLKFKDKQTPFADGDTVKWINDEVKSAAFSGGGGQNGSVILPPIMGEEYSSINTEYEAACNELPERFEEYFSAIQQSIEADIRNKGRFLRKLNLANYCIQAKKYSLAKVYLSELKTIIQQLNLDKWEPALCTAVWQSMYLVNSKLLTELNDENLIAIIADEQDALFNEIAKYNGLLALKLSQNNK